MVAIWHDPASAHEAPTWQPMHDPLLHTAPASQLVPLKAVPSTTHVGTPPSQSVMPLTHAPGEHGVPGVHVEGASDPASPASSVPGPVSATVVESVPASWVTFPPLELPWPSTDASLPPPVVKSPRIDVHPAVAAPATIKTPSSL